MNIKMAAIDSPEETTSVVTRNRIVCFVNDELSKVFLADETPIRNGLEFSGIMLKVLTATAHRIAKEIAELTEDVGKRVKS